MGGTFQGLALAQLLRHKYVKAFLAEVATGVKRFEVKHRSSLRPTWRLLLTRQFGFS